MQDVVIYGDKMEIKKNIVIKNILTTIDLSFDPEMRNSRTRDIIRKVVMDEINILRDQHGLANRTVTQLRTAIRNKLGS